MKNVNISVSVPGEIFLTLRETDKEFALNMKRYSALKFFQDQKLSIGQCAELAEMTEEDFIRLLSENNISIFDYITPESLKEDFKNA